MPHRKEVREITGSSVFLSRTDVKQVVQLSLLETSERSEGVDPSRRRGVCPSNPSRWVGDYACVRGGRYFRFYWQEWCASTRRLVTKHCAIRGGNVRNAIAQRNAEAVRGAIGAGKETGEIIRLIRSQGALRGNFRRVVEELGGTPQAPRIWGPNSPSPPELEGGGCGLGGGWFLIWG